MTARYVNANAIYHQLCTKNGTARQLSTELTMPLASVRRVVSRLMGHKMIEVCGTDGYQAKEYVYRACLIGDTKETIVYVATRVQVVNFAP